MENSAIRLRDAREFLLTFKKAKVISNYDLNTVDQISVDQLYQVVKTSKVEVSYV